MLNTESASNSNYVEGRRARPEFESQHLHRNAFDHKLGMVTYNRVCFSGGDTGNRLAQKSYVGIGNAKVVRIGGSRLKKQTKVNAKTSTTTGTVTVSGKNVKFSARTAKVALV